MSHLLPAYTDKCQYLIERLTYGAPVRHHRGRHISLSHPTLRSSHISLLFDLLYPHFADTFRELFLIGTAKVLPKTEVRLETGY
jgi:hypothetical protein